MSDQATAIEWVARAEQMLDRCTSHGWLTLPEAELLLRAASATSGPMIEVGSYQGRSAMFLAQLDRTVICVDPWADGFDSDLSGNEVYARFLAHTEPFPNIFPIRKRVEQLHPTATELVFLDGDHSYEGTLRQVHFALGCCAKVICVHDVNDTGEGTLTKRACLELLGPFDERAERLAVWGLTQPVERVRT